MSPAGNDADSAPATPTPQSPSRGTVRRAPRREHSVKKETMNGPLYMQASNNVVIVRRLKRKGEGPMKQLSRWFVENQIGTPYTP